MMFSGQFMNFLVGFHDIFAPIKDRILLLEPLSSVNKTFSMVITVEKQMDVQVLFNKYTSTTTLIVKSQGGNKVVDNHNPTQNINRRKENKNTNRKYNRYGGNGHLKESYFKLVCYLNGIKGLEI